MAEFCNEFIQIFQNKQIVSETKTKTFLLHNKKNYKIYRNYIKYDVKTLKKKLCNQSKYLIIETSKNNNQKLCQKFKP